jgi:WhiB family redox-sensing transcriptional regulator
VRPGHPVRNVTGSNQCVPVRHAGYATTTVEELPVPSFSPQPYLTLLTESTAETFAAPEPASSDESWRLDALCAETDPEAFFPEKGGSTREAKRVCTGCAVRAECLEFALGNDERFGIWGGLSERERRRLRLQRRIPLSA